MKEAVDSRSRHPEDTARDKYRHPIETLTFFEIEPDMRVVEIWPGDGWYTDILAPYLHDHGKLYVAISSGENEYKKKLADDPARFGKVTVTELDPPDKMEIAPADSADMVVTFRNVHNWMRGGYDEQVFKAMYIALKPGGILGVVEHRGDLSTPQDPKAASGYLREDYVTRLAEQAGFQLAGKSEINANPKDTKDYTKGVWTLPPTLRLGDTDKAKYLAIGESDRMTLRFVKPVATTRPEASRGHLDLQRVAVAIIGSRIADGPITQNLRIRDALAATSKRIKGHGHPFGSLQILLKAAAEASFDRPGRRQHLVGARSYPEVIGQVYPSYRSGRIKQKLSGPRDVMPLRTPGNVQQIVAPNHLRAWIGQDGERETSPFNEIAGDSRRINADRNRSDTLRLKLTHVFLDTPQLEVAEWSPMAPVKDEQNRFGWVRPLSRTREDLSKREGFSVAVDEGKVRGLLPHPRHSSGFG